MVSDIFRRFACIHFVPHLGLGDLLLGTFQSGFDYKGDMLTLDSSRLTYIVAAQT